MAASRSRRRVPVKWAMLAFAGVLAILVAANALRIYQSEHDRLMAQGEAEVHDAAVRLDTELRRMKAVLDTVAVEVEDFLAAGEPSHAQVEAFMREKTRRLKDGVDRNYLELYVARKGWYAGGLGWNPPASFIPERRPWFRRAMASPGRTVLQPPYQAMNRNMLMMAVSRLLRDGRTVLALDVDMAPFGPMARREMGERTSYVFFLSPDGTVVAHEGTAKSGRTVVGRVLEDAGADANLPTPEEEGVVIFTERVVDGWCAAVAVDRTRLLAPVWYAVFWQMLASVGLLAAGFIGLTFMLRRSRRAEEETTAANAVTMERALQALHARSSLDSYRAFLEIVRARFDGTFCYMSHFDLKARVSRIAKGACIFRDGTANTRVWTLELGRIEAQLGDFALDGFCQVDAAECRRIVGPGLLAQLPERAWGFQLLVSVPLIVSGRLWGALAVGFPHVRSLDPAERDNLLRVADVLASAIERRRTYEEVMRKNDELKVALAAAEQGERAKTTFLATMSHEIRTPLNAVVGFAEFLRAPGGCTEDERREYTEGILTSSRALLSLINDILDLSKIEAGRMDIRGGACDLAKLFREMEEIFRFRAEEKGIRLTASVAPGFPVLELQEERVRQILLNLVGNAVKFTAQGGVSLDAELDGDDLTVHVADTGAGIAPDRLEAVFNPFEQDGGVRGGKVYQGTGLGLPICRRLVESVGGTVTVASELGKGSTFTVRIPHVGRVAAKASEPPAPADTGRLAASLRAAARRRVYLVDDVALNLRVAARHVQRSGIAPEDIRTFLRAADALAALKTAAAAGELPLAVLTDMWMPEMDGEALARAVRGDPALERVPVVALTADADSAKSFDLALFDAVLTKPLTGDKVRALFKDLG